LSGRVIDTAEQIKKSNARPWFVQLDAIMFLSLAAQDSPA
jgi:hypothetical protein